MATVNGSLDNDSLHGTSGSDSLVGLDGDDYLDAGGGQAWTQPLRFFTNAVSVGSDGWAYTAGEASYLVGEEPLAGGRDAALALYRPDGSVAWTRTFGTAGEDAALTVDAAAGGSAFIGGYIDGVISPVDFGDATYDYIFGDAAIAKINPDGTEAWSASIASSGDDFTTGVAAATDGAVYTVGGFSGAVDGLTYTGSGGPADGDYYDGFIARYAADGTREWILSIGGAGDDYVNGVATGTDGSAYVLGSGSSGAFVSKYDAAGNLLWTNTVTGDATAVAVGPDGSIYVGGNFDNGTANRNDILVSKFNLDGSSAGSQSFGSSKNEFVRSIAVNGDGAVHVGVMSTGPLDGQPAAGSYDAYLVTLNPDLSLASTQRLWATGGYDGVAGVDVGPDGSIYAGYGSFNAGFLTRIQPNAGNDTLDGGDGNDTLVGGAGNDSLVGGAGDDTLYAGVGRDTVDGGDGTDILMLPEALNPNGDSDGPSYNITSGFTYGSSGFDITAPSGQVTHVSNVEILQFSDGAAVLVVGAGGYATIQSAIDAAVAGDIIIVSAGTYDENLVIDKSVHLVGAANVGPVDTPTYTIDPNTGAIQLRGGAGHTGEAVIAPSNGGPAITIRVNGSTPLSGLSIEGFTFDKAQPVGADVSGDAVIVLETDTVSTDASLNRIEGLRIADNVFADMDMDGIVGQGQHRAGVVIENNAFVSNRAGQGVNGMVPTAVYLGNVSAPGDSSNEGTAVRGNLFAGVYYGTYLSNARATSTQRVQVEGNQARDVAFLSLFDYDTRGVDVVSNAHINSADFANGTGAYAGSTWAGASTSVALYYYGTSTFKNVNDVNVSDLQTSNVARVIFASPVNVAGNTAYGVEGLTLDGQTVAGTPDGTPGRVVIGGDLNSTITGMTRFDTGGVPIPNSWADRLEGGGGNDTLNGRGGNDLLSGQSGDDVLDGGAGVDTLVGGDGDDTYWVDVNTDVVSEAASGSGGYDLMNVAFEASPGTYALAINVEAGNIGSQSSGFRLVGNALDNRLFGNEGADILDGDAGADGLYGYAGADSLLGGDGADTLDGGLGADTLTGGSGSDTYLVDNAGDLTIESAGLAGDIDTTISSINRNLSSNVERLTLVGTATVGSGNALNNLITANDLGNALSGVDGNDTLMGGAGADSLNGGTGVDSLVGGAGNDFYTVDNAADLIVEAADGGTDRVSASANYTLGANLENLTLLGAANTGTGNGLGNAITGNTTLVGGVGGVPVANTLSGLGGDDSLLGATGNDSLLGGDGNDTLNGGAGADTLVGGNGGDTYYVDNTGDVITELGTGGIDLIVSSVSRTMNSAVENLTLTGADALNVTGSALSNLITGNGGNNSLYGGLGDDTLLGGAGSDTLQGAGGNDSLEGGSGNDVYVVADAGDIVVEGAAAGTDRVSSSLSWTLGANFENLTLSGIASVDGTGNELGNYLTGNAGANHLQGLAGADTLIGDAGNDTVDGGSGADVLQGGTGGDTYIVDNTGDVTIESSTTPGEIDTIISSVSRTLSTNIERLTLTGSATTGAGNTLNNLITGNDLSNSLLGVAGADTLIGGLGNDTLNGGAGADSLVGGEGADVYAVDNAGDVVVELAGQGTDRVSSSVSWVLGDDVENLTLAGSGAIDGTGNALSNLINDNASANRIDGGAGNDTIYASGGADTLTGGLGADILKGGEGADVFRFVTTADGGDTISDFTSGTDKIQVTATNFGITAGSAVNLVNGGSASSGAAVFLYNATTGALSFDQDGNGAGAAITLAMLRNRPASLAVGDLVAG